jgi:farnesyl diphosphate synthase
MLGPEERVCSAMRYAALQGGKRLRPFLLVQAGRVCGLPPAAVMRTAAALEMVHAYSLTHDDLPAMDDAPLRRGQPSTHIAFGEATAILAGDGLLTEAFAVLADPATHPDAGVRAQLVAALAQAAGASGMVGGQMLDMLAGTTTLVEADCERLQSRKTGALFRFACEAPTIIAGAPVAIRQALLRYADAFGLAFQITDDIIDHVGDHWAAGKEVGRDVGRNKLTFVGLLGLERAQARAAALTVDAVAAVAPYGPASAHLAALAQWLLVRES